MWHPCKITKEVEVMKLKTGNIEKQIENTGTQWYIIITMISSSQFNHHHIQRVWLRSTLSSTQGNHSTSDSNFLSFHPHPQWFKGFRMRPKWRAEAGMIGLWTWMASPGPSPSCHSMVSPVILRPALSFQWQQLEWHRNEKILIIRPFLKGLGLEWEILRTFGQNLHFSSEWVGMACKWVQNEN